MLGALLAQAQGINVPVQAIPGGADQAFATGVGYFRWVFGVLAVLIILGTLLGIMTGHHPNGWWTFGTALVCCILAATVPKWLPFFYPTS